MSEEKRLILKMLKEDKISEDEAMKLLDAIGDSKEEAANKTNFSEGKIDTEPFEKKVEAFAEKIVSGLDSAFKTVGEKIKNIEVGYDFDMSYDGDPMFSFSKLKSTTEKEIDLDLDSAIVYDLEVFNTNGQVKMETWDGEGIRVRARVRFNDKYMDENYEFIKTRIENNKVTIDSRNTEFKKQPYIADMVILLPSIRMQDITVNTVNGSVTQENLDCRSLVVDSSNGTITILTTKADTCNLETVNGSITIEDLESQKLNLESVNGKLNCITCNLGEVTAETVNGMISCRESVVESFSANTVNGGIRMLGLTNTAKILKADTVNGQVLLDYYESNRPAKIQCSLAYGATDKLVLPGKFVNVEKSKRELTATTKDFREDLEDKLDINITTVNGRFTIEEN